MTKRIDTKAVLARMQSIYGCDCIPGKTPGLLNQFRELCAALAQEITDSETKQSRIEELKEVEEQRDEWRRQHADLARALMAREARIEALENRLVLTRVECDALARAVDAKQNIIKSIQRTVNDHLDAEAALAAREKRA